jgi:colanic acid/amylovoran biosynthesis glycosyltransferase
MKEENMSFLLEIAGDGPLKREYQEKVRQYGLGAYISFIGPLPHYAVPKWLRGLDAFVLACRKDKNNDMDGIPVVLMEAMTSYVPVVSTRISGIPELVEDEITGCLAEPGDSSSLANAITRVLGEHDLRSYLCDNALKHINKNFNLRKNTNSLLKHFEGVAS